ncbi:3-methyl-2-oxobutanoate hydroxymethyltransferase, partial [Marinicauda pacifica]
MSAQSETPVKRQTPPSIRARKGGEPIVCLTAYDAPTAGLLDPHCDVLLVGDSLGMVVHGLPSTIGVTMEMMILHGQAVMRRARQALVVIDMPFGSYEKSPQQAFENASRILAETGAQAVKLETGAFAAETVRFLTERGVPVMGHVGLRPQASLADGGFKAKGRSQTERDRVLEEARLTDEAGAFSIVIEGTSQDLAEEISAAVSAPTIGIGASAKCDGQVLVVNDMLGQSDWVPRFVKKYADLRGLTDEAARRFAEEVRARSFPGPEHVYH